MEHDVDIRLLSQKFSADYPANLYPELMLKHGRPYTCLLIDTHDDFLICVPFRSSISHKSAYLFKNTRRSQQSKSGLDYTKIVLIKDPGYIDSGHAIVDNDEYVETMQNLDKITDDVNKYLNDYCLHITGAKTLDKSAFNRKYKYSTLKYFHDILGITS